MCSQFRRNKRLTEIIVPHDVFLLMYQYLLTRGIELKTIEEHTLVAYERLREIEPFLTIEQADLIWSRLTLLSENPLFGMSFGSNVPTIAQGHPFLAMVACSDSLEAAFELIVKYHSAVHHEMHLSITRPSDTTLTIQAAPSKRYSAEVDVNFQKTTGLFGMLAGLVKFYFGDSVYPNKLELLANESEICDKTRLERIFGPCIEFHSPRYALQFPLDLLRKPLPLADHGFLDTLKVFMDKRIKLRKGEAKWTERVFEQLVELSPPYKHPIENTALNLNLSVRTLQGKLKAEGTNYKFIEDGYRRQVAQHMLINTDLPVSTVAYNLQYSDQSAFTKAFKAWTKTTPKKFRTLNARPSPDKK